VVHRTADVYWTNINTVRGCAKNGCNNNPTTFAQNLGNRPYGIATDGTDIFWTNWEPPGNVVKCSTGGCGGNPTSLGSNLGQPWGIAVDNTTVYFTDNGTKTYVCAKGGCNNTPTAVTTVNGSYPKMLAIDANNTYWMNSWSPTNATVTKCAIGGCGNNPTILASGLKVPGAITVDATDVYWVDLNGTVSKCSINGCGNNPTVLVSGLTITLDSGIVVDGTNVYFMTDTAIAKCALGGCGNKPTTIVTRNVNQPIGDLAIDSVAIYWTENIAGTVSKVAK
jgi:hypothetical protein